jgi:hypothetical protein
MKRWIQVVLAASLAFNFGFLGVFIYRVLEQRTHKPSRNPVIREERRIIRDSPTPYVPPEKIELGSHENRHIRVVRRENQPRIQQIRLHLIREKQTLHNTFFEDPLDSARIISQLETVLNLQMEMNREVISGLIRETRVLDPDERESYIRLALRKMERDAKQKHLREPDPVRHNHQSIPQGRKRRNVQ